MMNKKNIKHDKTIRKPFLFFLFHKVQRSIKKQIRHANSRAMLE